MQDDVSLADDTRARQGRREGRDGVVADREDHDPDVGDPRRWLAPVANRQGEGCWYAFLISPVKADGVSRLRSEEHTSELQSRENLVCRLLLEKKKIKIKIQ